MKFKVERTSEWDDEKPCEEAVEEAFTRIDVRVVKHVDEFRLDGVRNTWYTEGTNHSTNAEGFLQREFDDTGWFVEIGTLEELVNFIEKYGQVVIGKSWRNRNIMMIEIYDTYRE